MLSGGVAQDLVNKIIFNYPTLAEGYRIAGFNALNKLFVRVIPYLPLLFVCQFFSNVWESLLKSTFGLSMSLKWGIDF